MKNCLLERGEKKFILFFEKLFTFKSLRVSKFVRLLFLDVVRSFVQLDDDVEFFSEVVVVRGLPSAQNMHIEMYSRQLTLLCTVIVKLFMLRCEQPFFNYVFSVYFILNFFYFTSTTQGFCWFVYSVSSRALQFFDTQTDDTLHKLKLICIIVNAHKLAYIECNRVSCVRRFDQEANAERQIALHPKMHAWNRVVDIATSWVVIKMWAISELCGISACFKCRTNKKVGVFPFDEIAF